MDTATRIKNSVKLLDEKGPRDWRERLLADLDRLDINSAENCVLGKIYGDYYDGVDALGLGGGSDRMTYAFASDLHNLGTDGSDLRTGWINYLSSLDATEPALAPQLPTNVVTLTIDQLRELVNEAHRVSPTWGDYTDIGLVVEFLRGKGLF